MKDKVIAVVMGGPSAEREVSLRTGKAISKALQEKGYKIVDIDLVPEKFAEQLKEAQAEVVFNAIHGLYGEDGKIQGFLDMLGIPYTGSDVEACAISMDKHVTKQLFSLASIPSPKGIFLDKNGDMNNCLHLVKELNLPIIVKPNSQGSTIGVTVVKKLEEVEEALKLAFEYSDAVLIEEFIQGKEYTVAVMLDKDGIRVFPAIEIVPHSGAYDYKSKYTVGATTYICPAELDDKLKEQLKEYAYKAFSLLKCQGVARVDYMIDSKGNVFVLEINTVPGMTETSLVPKAALVEGIDFGELCERILFSAESKMVNCS